MSGARRDRHRDRARTGIGQPDRREHPDAGSVIAVRVLKRAAGFGPSDYGFEQGRVTTSGRARNHVPRKQ